MDPNTQPEGQQDPLTPVEVVHEPPRRPPRRRPSALRGLFFLLVFLAFGASVMLNFGLLFGGGAFRSGKDLREEFVSHERFASDKVAVISVDGMIYDEDDGHIKRQIDQAAEDDDVKAIVLRVDSPGGTVTGSDYIYHHLKVLRRERKIPLVVSMGSLAASGGYYVSMAVGETPESIFAEPTTWTGSIGVIIPHYDLSALLAEWGIEEDSIASHPLKNMGSFAKDMTEKERAIFQELVDETFERFKEVVKSGRPQFKKDPEALDEVATGQVFTAEQALELGLVDKIDFFEGAVDRAIELAGLDEDDVRVVKYKRELTLADVLLGVRAAHDRFELADVLDATVPRAYYLWSRVPPLVRSRPR